jgi:crossover junction endodeoxyribonuclease RuvC
MRVAGIDPGSYATGYGIVDRSGNRFVASRSGVVRGRAGTSLVDRLGAIHDGVLELLRREMPDAVAVETPFYAKSVKSTLILGHVRGVVLLAVREVGAELFEYAPRQVKSAVVGNGAASKEQIQFMVKRLLALAEEPPPDAADALAVAICHHHRSTLLHSVVPARSPSRSLR